MTETDEQKKKRTRGVSLNLLNILLVFIGIVVGILMIINNVQTNKNYHVMDEVISESLLSQNATGMMEGISTGMSASAQAFVESGEIGNVHSYIGQRGALNAEFGETGMFSRKRLEEDPYLAQAISAFDALRTTEWTAMRLKAATLPMPESALPEMLQAVKLSEEDAALSAEEKVAKAAAMLSTPEYAALKTQLTDAVDESHRFVSERASEQSASASEALKNVVNRQRLLIILFIVVAFFALVANRMMVLQPIIRSTKMLDSRERIPERGCSEMRHLAHVYNDVLQDNKVKAEALSYAASHDALTGLYNRAAFDKAYSQSSKSTVGILMVDVDDFKHFNDEYGHDMGDRVLNRVTDALKHSLRENDMICRIGGDEFGIIMADAGIDQADRVREMAASINAKLSKGTEDTPPITISVGAAFWNRPNPGPDIFKDADTALLDVKKSGKSNCKIYGLDD